jgi:hypothetical protein
MTDGLQSLSEIQQGAGADCSHSGNPIHRCDGMRRVFGIGEPALEGLFGAKPGKGVPASVPGIGVKRRRGCGTSFQRSRHGSARVLSTLEGEGYSSAGQRTDQSGRFSGHHQTWRGELAPAWTEVEGR